MASNTGYQQAIIAKKVTIPSGYPLDVDGELTSISGKLQAILLLEGQSNPDTTKYEVEGTFKAGEVVDGKPTKQYNTGKCPINVPVYPDPYETLPKNARTVFHFMDVWDAGTKASAHGVTPADMDNWIEGRRDHEGNPDGFWNARDSVDSNNWIFTASGTHEVIDCDEISFFARPLRQTLGQNGNLSHDAYAPLDIRKSDLSGERMFQRDVATIKDFITTYGSYYPWGVVQLTACFYPQGNTTIPYGAGWYIYEDNTKANDITDGWTLPTTDIMLQLIGQLPRHHEQNSTGTRWDDIRDFFFCNSERDIINVVNVNWGHHANISGISLLPAGKLPNDSGKPSQVEAFGTTHVMPTLRRNGSVGLTSFAVNGSPLHQLGIRVSSLVAYAHGGNIRICRPKTIQELGYRLVCDNTLDKVTFEEVTWINPDSSRYKELPTGMERGIALRYANRKNKVVLKKWSEIQTEAIELQSSYIVNIESV